MLSYKECRVTIEIHVLNYDILNSSNCFLLTPLITCGFIHSDVLYNIDNALTNIYTETMPNRSFWVDAKESLEQNSKTATLSSRILGIGIIFVAFLVLSIGLIVGLKFPGFVEERIKEDQCIVSDESSNYKQWVMCLSYLYTFYFIRN